MQTVMQAQEAMLRQLREENQQLKAELEQMLEFMEEMEMPMPVELTKMLTRYLKDNPEAGTPCILVPPEAWNRH
jgi:serine phosphatase RsbU (regulator of sigma subunit)